MFLTVQKITLETNEGEIVIDVEEGFFVHEESDVFPMQVKVQNGSYYKTSE